MRLFVILTIYCSLCGCAHFSPWSVYSGFDTGRNVKPHDPVYEQGEFIYLDLTEDPGDVCIR